MDAVEDGAVDIEGILGNLGLRISEIFTEAFVTQPIEQFASNLANQGLDAIFPGGGEGGASTASEEAQKQATAAQLMAAGTTLQGAFTTGGTAASTLASAGTTIGTASTTLGTSAGALATSAAQLQAAATALTVANASSAANATGGVISSGLSGFPGFDRSTLGVGRANQQGTVVNRPTTLPGGGSVGEAGRPEAILPLERTAGGGLGVRAEGMGGGSITNNTTNVNVTQNIQTPDSNSFRESQGQLLADARRRSR